MEWPWLLNSAYHWPFLTSTNSGSGYQRCKITIPWPWPRIQRSFYPQRKNKTCATNDANAPPPHIHIRQSPIIIYISRSFKMRQHNVKFLKKIPRYIHNCMYAVTYTDRHTNICMWDAVRCFFPLVRPQTMNRKILLTPGDLSWSHRLPWTPTASRQWPFNGDRPRCHAFTCPLSEDVVSSTNITPTHAPKLSPWSVSPLPGYSRWTPIMHVWIRFLKT